MVGKRRDPRPVLLIIDAERAAADGIPFYRGDESVVLADAVPAKYICQTILSQ